MLTFLHISDLHFGPPFLPAVAESLLRIVPSLEPDVIICSGDFTQRAKQEQFESAGEFLRRLPGVPRVVTPGNHDVALYRLLERFLRPFDLYRQYISEELDSVLRLDGVVVVALNSTRPRQAITNGRLDSSQLEFCKGVLRDVPAETVKIVVTHHHFLPAPDFERDEVMPKTRRALDLFVALRVDLILGGHLHRAYIGNTLDVYAGADREHGTIIVQCGTTTSRRGRGREREKNSFNLIRIDDVIEITHYLYFDAVDGFAPVSAHRFPRPAKRVLDESLALQPAL
jgi:3',5'-cyclic AMP phosphodiesterase CpdA